MHLELAPPPAQGLGRSLSLALVVHVMLLIALTWGIQWQNMDNTPAVEAELWSALPKAAAPPPPPPAPEPTPEPPPPPPAPKVKPTPPPASRDADIAIAKQKKAEQKDKEKALEQQRQRVADEVRGALVQAEVLEDGAHRRAPQIKPLISQGGASEYRRATPQPACSVRACQVRWSCSL